jgi:hypothetical protein
VCALLQGFGGLHPRVRWCTPEGKTLTIKRDETHTQLPRTEPVARMVPVPAKAQGLLSETVIRDPLTKGIITLVMRKTV